MRLRSNSFVYAQMLSCDEASSRSPLLLEAVLLRLLRPSSWAADASPTRRELQSCLRAAAAVRRRPLALVHRSTLCQELACRQALQGALSRQPPHSFQLPPLVTRSLSSLVLHSPRPPMVASTTTLVAGLALLGSAAASWTTGSTTVKLEARDLGLKNGDGSVNIPGLLAETERLSRCVSSTTATHEIAS